MRTIDSDCDYLLFDLDNYLKQINDLTDELIKKGSIFGSTGQSYNVD